MNKCKVAKARGSVGTLSQPELTTPQDVDGSVEEHGQHWSENGSRRRHNHSLELLRQNWAWLFASRRANHGHRCCHLGHRCCHLLVLGGASLSWRARWVFFTHWSLSNQFWILVVVLLLLTLQLLDTRPSRREYISIPFMQPHSPK